jgi:hypothetical protein
MSKEFIEAEMALFMEQLSAKGWGADIVLTTVSFAFFFFAVCP